MNSRLLELHFAQLTKAWNKSKNNNYSDKDKESYHQKLGDLYNHLKNEDFTSFSPEEIEEKCEIIDLIFKSLEFLDSSTLNFLPFEIVKCLDSALKDWLIGDEKLIIVTSLVKDIHNYSFDQSLATNEQLFKYIELKYGVKFDSRLIQINLPAVLSRDYLANVVLYHELGHFIDTKYHISGAIHDEIIDRLFYRNFFKDNELKNLITYFPFLADDKLKDYYETNGKVSILESYIAEYFCDLFASQYIKDCSSIYLQYLTQSNISFDSETHPSTEKRVRLTNSFLLGNSRNFTLKLIKEAVRKITDGKTFSIKFEEKNSSELINLTPMDIENDNQLHFLFIHGWDLWVNNWQMFEKANKMEFNLDRDKVYDIVNGLIEKSIGNYVVKTNWEKAKKNVSK